jgi:hypothetical protein
MSRNSTTRRKRVFKSSNRGKNKIIRDVDLFRLHNAVARLGAIRFTNNQLYRNNVNLFRRNSINPIPNSRSRY